MLRLSAAPPVVVPVRVTGTPPMPVALTPATPSAFGSLKTRPLTEPFVGTETLAVSVTGAPVGSCAVTLAVLLPPLKGAVAVQVHVAEAPGARLASAGRLLGVRAHCGAAASVIVAPVRVALPVFWTRRVKVIVSPAL